METSPGDTNNTTPQPLPAEAPAPAAPEPDYGRRRCSKIGRLPKAVRDKLNFMLLDGVAHAEIPVRLGDVAKDITEKNVQRWATHSYPLWLAEYNRLQETRVTQEAAMDRACPDGGSKIHEGTLQLAATRLSEMVRDLDCSDFKELLRDDPAKLIPFLNSLATISNAEIKCERHRYELEQRLPKEQDPKQQKKAPGLSIEARRTIESDMNLM